MPLSIAIHRGEPVPSDVNDLVLKCLAKSVDDRYESVKELSVCVAQLRTNHPWTFEQATEWWKVYGGE